MPAIAAVVGSPAPIPWPASSTSVAQCVPLASSSLPSSFEGNDRTAANCCQRRQKRAAEALDTTASPTTPRRLTLTARQQGQRAPRTDRGRLERANSIEGTRQHQRDRPCAMIPSALSSPPDPAPPAAAVAATVSSVHASPGMDTLERGMEHASLASASEVSHDGEPAAPARAAAAPPPPSLPVHVPSAPVVPTLGSLGSLGSLAPAPPPLYPRTSAPTGSLSARRPGPGVGGLRAGVGGGLRGQVQVGGMKIPPSLQAKMAAVSRLPSNASSRTMKLTSAILCPRWHPGLPLHRLHRPSRPRQPGAHPRPPS